MANFSTHTKRKWVLNGVDAQRVLRKGWAEGRVSLAQVRSVDHMRRPWTIKEVVLAIVVALLFAVVAVLAPEGLAQILLVIGGTP